LRRFVAKQEQQRKKSIKEAAGSGHPPFLTLERKLTMSTISSTFMALAPAASLATNSRAGACQHPRRTEILILGRPIGDLSSGGND
jgi:hypothetical protein